MGLKISKPVTKLENLQRSNPQKPSWCIQNPSLNPERIQLIIESWKILQNGTSPRWLACKEKAIQNKLLMSDEKKLKENFSLSMKSRSGSEKRFFSRKCISNNPSLETDTSLPSLHLRSRNAYAESLKVVIEEDQPSEGDIIKIDSLNTGSLSNLEKDQSIQESSNPQPSINEVSTENELNVIQEDEEEELDKKPNEKIQISYSVKKLAKLISAKLKNKKLIQKPVLIEYSIEEFYAIFFDRMAVEHLDVQKLVENFDLKKHGQMFAEIIHSTLLELEGSTISSFENVIKQHIESLEAKGLDRRHLLQGCMIFIQTFSFCVGDEIFTEQCMMAWMNLLSMFLDISLPHLSHVKKTRLSSSMRTLNITKEKIAFYHSKLKKKVTKEKKEQLLSSSCPVTPKCSPSARSLSLQVQK